MNTSIEKLKATVRDIPNFPQAGITFKDITPVLANPETMRLTTEALTKLLSGFKFNKIIGIESRGFVFGSILAHTFGVGFIPVRKPGKLPHATIKASYSLEYGKDILEIHADAIQPGDLVLIHDDVLATGGTASATIKLVEQLGGKVVALAFFIEISVLGGAQKLAAYNTLSLLKY